MSHDPPPRTTTCLLVDDDEFSAEVFREMLQQDGLVQVVTAANGRCALRALANMQEAPDVLICDLYMPDMDGFEFMAQLGRQHYTGGIVLVSGENIEVLVIARQVASEDGLNVIGAFTKPLSRDLLLEVLAQRMPMGSGAEQIWGRSHR